MPTLWKRIWSPSAFHSVLWEIEVRHSYMVKLQRLLAIQQGSHRLTHYDNRGMVHLILDSSKITLSCLISTNRRECRYGTFHEIYVMYCTQNGVHCWSEKWHHYKYWRIGMYMNLLGLFYWVMMTTVSGVECWLCADELLLYNVNIYTVSCGAVTFNVKCVYNITPFY